GPSSGPAYPELTSCGSVKALAMCGTTRRPESRRGGLSHAREETARRGVGGRAWPAFTLPRLGWLGAVGVYHYGVTAPRAPARVGLDHAHLGPGCAAPRWRAPRGRAGPARPWAERQTGQWLRVRAYCRRRHSGPRRPAGGRALRSRRALLGRQ